MDDFPFLQVDSGVESGVFFRVFNKKTKEDDLVWHRDKKDREVTVLVSEGWKLQADNRIPIELTAGQTTFIPKEFYHRLIKGQGVLIVRIEE